MTFRVDLRGIPLAQAIGRLGCLSAGCCWGVAVDPTHPLAITFHDPLAAACVFDPDLCTYRTGRVTMGVEPGRGFGVTSFEAYPNGPHRVAAAVNADRFFKHYFEVTSVFRP